MQNVNTWIEISRKRLKHNLNQFRTITCAQIMPIIKSNAYGHGMMDIAKIIEEHVNWFGVVNSQEAIELRSQGIKKPIFILSFFLSSEEILLKAATLNIHFPLYTVEDAHLLNKVGERTQTKINVHVKIDTGTGRLGILPNQIQQFIDRILAFPWIHISGIFSHFAAGEELPDYTEKQLLVFQSAIRDIEQRTGKVQYKHFACSSAALVTPKSQYDIIRIGISLYGLWPSELCKKITHKSFPTLELLPALTWKTRIIQIKTIPKGTPIGYGCSYTTTRKTKIAILPVGYADGYDRKLSNQAQVLINGQRCSILGRICMNLCMVDVTDVFNLGYTHEVVLLGQQGKEIISADELAAKIGTIHYEVVTRIHPHISRIYV